MGRIPNARAEVQPMPCCELVWDYSLDRDNQKFRLILFKYISRSPEESEFFLFSTYWNISSCVAEATASYNVRNHHAINCSVLQGAFSKMCFY